MLKKHIMKKFNLTIGLVLAAGILLAQWTPDTELNTLVASSETGDIQAVATSDGKTYVAFWHDVPAPQFYEMRLQLLDADGYALFGPEGLLVNGSVPMSSYTTLWSMAVDGDDNLYLCFNGTGAGSPVFLHKIAPDGALLWSAQPGSGFVPRLLPLSDGGVVIGWLEDDTYMQKYDASGSPVWAAPVVVAPGVSGATVYIGEWAEMSNGDFTLIFHNQTFPGLYALPYVQRFDANGDPVWAAPVALTTNVFASFYSRYTLVQDGDVLYFGYTGSIGLNFYSYLLRIDPDGTLPWGPNGSSMITASNGYELNTSIAGEPGSDVIWALCQVTDETQNQSGEFLQKYDRETGARLLGDQAKEIFPISSDYIYHQGQLQVVEDQPFFVISDGYGGGVTPVDLLAVYLDANGDFAWPEETRPVATNTTGVKSRVQWLRPHNGRSVCVWTEDRTGQSLAYAQRAEAVEISSTPEAAALSDVRLYPNPSKGASFLQLGLKEASGLSLRIVDVEGSVCFEESRTLPAGEQVIALPGELPAGIYWILLDLEGATRVLPMTVIR
jgi:hypothetical protein